MCVVPSPLAPILRSYKTEGTVSAALALPKATASAARGPQIPQGREPYSHATFLPSRLAPDHRDLECIHKATPLAILLTPLGWTKQQPRGAERKGLGPSRCERNELGNAQLFISWGGKNVSMFCLFQFYVGLGFLLTNSGAGDGL